MISWGEPLSCVVATAFDLHRNRGGLSLTFWMSKALSELPAADGDSAGLLSIRKKVRGDVTNEGRDDG